MRLLAGNAITAKSPQSGSPEYFIRMASRLIQAHGLGDVAINASLKAFSRIFEWSNAIGKADMEKKTV